MPDCARLVSLCGSRDRRVDVAQRQDQYATPPCPYPRSPSVYEPFSPQCLSLIARSMLSFGIASLSAASLAFGVAVVSGIPPLSSPPRGSHEELVNAPHAWRRWPPCMLDLLPFTVAAIVSLVEFVDCCRTCATSARPKALVATR